MAYTEIRKINGRKYYYRVISVREKNKVSKRRVYLGCELPTNILFSKEREADAKLLRKKLLAKRMKLNKEINKIKLKITSLLKKNKVKRAGIFGSYARGAQGKNSDIDILVEIDDPQMSLTGFIGLGYELEKILRRKVDLVEYIAIKPLIKERILNEEVRIL